MSQSVYEKAVEAGWAPCVAHDTARTTPCVHLIVDAVIDECKKEILARWTPSVGGYPDASELLTALEALKGKQ